MAKIISDPVWLVVRNEQHHIYGFHIDATNSDPYSAVTYIEDAVGMQPAGMYTGIVTNTQIVDYTSMTGFNYGSWKDAFFMPRPCMLKYDGTVDYYLDPDDYSKKEDGTASDISDFNYAGNAMMEWGRDGKKIWYKIVPENATSGTTGPISASVYVADYQVDNDYHAWSFINNQGDLVDHFYTAIYQGSVDSSGRLRSISGKGNSSDNGLFIDKLAAQVAIAVARNNLGSTVLWGREIFADRILINILLILITKTLNSQGALGPGITTRTSGSNPVFLASGTLNRSGLFAGGNDSTDQGVKVFGMEHWWGNLPRQYDGCVLTDNQFRVKLTYGMQDGSQVIGYPVKEIASNFYNYLLANDQPSSNGGPIRCMYFNSLGYFLPYYSGNNSKTYWSDRFWSAQTPGLKRLVTGGWWDAGQYFAYCGAFSFLTDPTGTPSTIGANSCLSCKPASA